jgi:carboxylesterase
VADSTRNSKDHEVEYMNEYVKPFFLQGNTPNECVLLIHGFTGSAADMRPLAEALNRDGKGRNVSAILLPNHGTRMEDMLWSRWKKWVLFVSAHIRELQKSYEKVSLVGFSMGGDIALCLAATQKIHRVICINTPILIRNKLYFFAEILSFFRKYTYWRKPTPIEGELLLDYKTGYPGMPVRSIAEIRKITFAAFYRLRRIKQPILIIQGLLDRTVHPKSPYIIYDGVQSIYKELLLLENTGHSAMRGPEREKMFRAVDEFLYTPIPDRSEIAGNIHPAL